MVNGWLKSNLLGANELRQPARIALSRQSERIFATEAALTSNANGFGAHEKSFWFKRFLVYYFSGRQAFAVGTKELG
jgi:hypothetical protein